MIIVTGANGRLGRLVVEELLHRVPAERIGVSVRSPGAAEDLAQRGVRVRRGDFTDPASLADAFEGASQVLLVSVDALGEASVAQHRAAIDAAKQAGARRILYTSHVGASASSPFPPMVDHAATEELLARSGVAYTSLRHGFYANNLVHLIEDGLRAGELRVPEDGPVSWTTHEDLAAADAAILADEGVVDGISPPLTAPAAPAFAEIAQIATEALGRPVGHTTVPDDEWVAGFVRRTGTPEPQVRFLLTIFAAARAGGFAGHDPLLEKLIGGPARGVRDVVVSASAG